MLLPHMLKQAAHSVVDAGRCAVRAGRRPADAPRCLADVGRTLLSLMVPPLCLGCETVMGSEERWLCARCRVRVSRSVRPRIRTVEVGGSGSDAGGPLAFRISYALDYDSIVSRLITDLKYGDKPGLAGILAPLMNSALAGAVSKDTVVVPVPIHPSRRRERGYNQSELLAVRIARARGLKLESDLLVKSRSTSSQTALEREERMENVAGSFGVRRADRLAGREVLLIDDVVTTGSTLKECARAVLKSGAREVSACVAASSP